ncbi:MAG: sugar phosphate isomerase/epimerase family protein [Bacillota bacterium]|nr:sugar phosphate isomerase/epimerase family protein [Bacillota bacterium]
MKLATTTADFRAYGDGSTASHVRLFASTGFKYLDYSFYKIIYPGSPFLSSGDGWKNEILASQEAAAALGLVFVQAHAPDGEHFVPGETRDALILATKRSIEACAMLGIPSTVIHAAQHPDPNASPSEFIDVNLRFYETLYDTAEQQGVNILIENSCEQNAPRYYLRTGREMKEFLAHANHPLMHACWDTGHAHMRHMDQYQSIIDLGKDLYGVHIQDNYGDRDSHVMPFMGDCNFDQVLQGLIDIDYAGAFTLECGSGIRFRNEWPHSRKPFIYRDQTVETLLDPPLSVKQMYVKLMYAVGKHMLEQYHCFED